MTVAVTGAFLIGHWPEAAMVMALDAIVEALEARAADRARATISRLMELAPEQARVQLPRAASSSEGALRRGEQAPTPAVDSPLTGDHTV